MGFNWATEGNRISLAAAGKGSSPGDEGPATRSKSAAGDEDCRSILGPVPDRSSPNPASPSRGQPAVNDGPDAAAVVVGERAPGLDHVRQIGGECAGVCAARIWDRCISRQSKCGFDSRLGHCATLPEQGLNLPCPGRLAEGISHAPLGGVVSGLSSCDCRMTTADLREPRSCRRHPLSDDSRPVPLCRGVPASVEG